MESFLGAKVYSKRRNVIKIENKNLRKRSLSCPDIRGANMGVHKKVNVKNTIYSKFYASFDFEIKAKRQDNNFGNKKPNNIGKYLEKYRETKISLCRLCSQRVKSQMK